MRHLVATRRSSWSPESASRNWAGTATLPLSSTPCSKWPLNIPPTAGIHRSTLGSTPPHLAPQQRRSTPGVSYLSSKIFGGLEGRGYGPHAARRGGAVSRVLSPPPGSGGSSHSSGPPVARGIERPTRGKRAGHPYPSRRTGSLIRGLAPGGVYRASALTSGPGELLPRPFTLAPGTRPGAVSSLWHFPPVSRGRR